MNKKVLLLALISLFLLSCVSSAQVNAPDVIWVKENYSTPQKTTDAVSSESFEVDQTVARSFQKKSTVTIRAEHRMLKFSSTSYSPSFSRHMMCKGHDRYYNPIEPTTVFSPSDIKAECLTTVSINDTIEFRWYYRSNSSKTWVSCYNWSKGALFPGEYYYEGHLLIAGYWPGYHYPRAYKVDVYLDGSLSFSEYFEVTNAGLNSPRMCEDVNVNGDPVNMKSRFTIGVDAKAQHYLRFDKIAYFNEELGCCHNFTTIWIQPDGSTYKTYSGSFTDYKDTNVAWNFWGNRYISDDYMPVNSGTPVGNWRVEVYLDNYYFNNTWMHYGPVATTPFIVGSESVADWTFMVYLNADSNLEEAGIRIFEYMASVGSSSQMNIVTQMDRIAGWLEKGEWKDDLSYGNWTDCKRFYVIKDMIPTPGNATLHLGEVNMGRPDTLRDFVSWTIDNYPANYYFLALWGHGTGSMGVCFDFTDANDGLSLPELSQALSGLSAIMDVVFLDACSMGMIEVAYQIRDYANVLVGPEGLGYAPPPYNEYLLSLTSNPSMLPDEFAERVVTSYIDWCKRPAFADDIHNATMAATDLTKITSLMAAVEDLALKLKESEKFYNYLIGVARNQTGGFLGPYDFQIGYHIDLYDFAQSINQHVLDEELKNAAHQVMTTLENVIIREAHKARPDSNGLSIYFPDEKSKYDYFGSTYEAITFAEDTPWDEFVIYYLDIQKDGYLLTIKTPKPHVSVKIDNKSYTTDTNKLLKVFILPDSYTIKVPITILIEPNKSRVVFTQWKDEDVSNPRTLEINREKTLEALYESTDFYLTVETYPIDLTPQPKVDPSGPWYSQDSSVTCTAKDISGYIFDHWTVDADNKGSEIQIEVLMDKHHEVTAYYVIPPSWWENLLRPDIMQVILGLAGIALTVALVVPAWVRTRRRRGVIRTFLNEIDEIYSRFKTDPRRCEEELGRLRNTILEGLTDGKITEEGYNIMDKKIDKYMEELHTRKKPVSKDK